MESYEILEIDDDSGLSIIKILSGEFTGLLLSLYNIGCNNEKFFFNYNILNEKEYTNIENLNLLMTHIVKNIYFKEKL